MLLFNNEITKKKFRRQGKQSNKHEEVEENIRVD